MDSAIPCIAVSPPTKLLGERSESLVAVFASLAAAGSSVHGWSTTRGLSARIVSPDFPVLPSVPKPLM
jgi:hypothetical protein